ncbi:polyphosphate kinase 2 [Novosphingobium panipatense]|uniref:ADP/GDP-polyphosphate phosphotransferase n=1 Tax=Novosphingobium panipatense TaxID=428991 RepID=A0ABY1QG55_9SPHN|nr:polyphosphate kinase 2 [Novosphingobium panipatense]SMP70302.1 transcriptional regulator [Novosphingobium panipatense]
MDDSTRKIGRKDYQKLLEPMKRELVGAARWAQVTGARIVVIFEGRDTAGKGGAIKAVSGQLNPRQCRTVALAAPSEREQGQWYFQRYITHLPTRGEIVLFDRSWYNRAGVERVMGYASEAQVEAFLRDAPVFEHMLIADGILLFKYWLACDQDKQEERLAERLEDPLKRWKLSPVDIAAREKYAEYTRAREAMLKATHTTEAPWTLVDFNDQRRGRLTLIRDLLDRLPDTQCSPPEYEFPPLEGKLQPEEFGFIQPIPPFPLS